MSKHTWLEVVALGLVFAGCGGKSTPAVEDGAGQLDVEITSPNGNVSILTGTALTLRARFSDGRGEVTPDAISWASSIAGQPIPQQNPADNVVLAAGTHVITASGSFAHKTGSATVNVTVGNIGVEITWPGNGSHVGPGDAVTFTGQAYEVQGVDTVPLAPSSTVTFQWSSALAPDFATGDLVADYTGLPIGSHTITLTVTDSTNPAAPLVGTASITLVVNTPPEVAITAPDNCWAGVDLAAGVVQGFAGRAHDTEDGDLTGTWTDTLTGTTAAGNTFTFQSTTLGRHDVVFEATDSLGDTARSTCHVNVYPAGGSAADLFPSTSGINADLPNGDNVRFVGNDGGTNTLIGNQDALAIFDATPALVGAPYSGGDLGVGGDPNVNGAVVSGGKMVVATSNGLAICTYASGVLSACAQVDDGSAAGFAYRAVAVSGSLSGSAVLAAAAGDGGLYLASYANGNPTAHVFPRATLDADSVRDVAFVGTALYVATNAGMCVIADPSAAVAAASVTPCTKRITRDDSILPTDNVNTLAVSGTTVWIGTEDGLARYEVATGGMSVYGHGDGLVSNQVNDIALDAAGIVWLATDGGVSRFDPVSASFTSLRGGDWDGNSMVNAIYVDGNGAKWFGTSAGVVKYIGA